MDGRGEVWNGSNGTACPAVDGQGPARPGQARHGTAGKQWQGKAGLGQVRLRGAVPGLAGTGTERQQGSGDAGRGEVRRREARTGVA